jgi:hypothetical protein
MSFVKFFTQFSGKVNSMKRVIREVITIIKVERWLVAEDAPSLAETDAVTLAPTLPETTLDPDISAALQESAHPDLGDGTKVTRVISQRVLDRKQYQVK